MTDVDLAALEIEAGPRIVLASEARISTAGSSAAQNGFSSGGVLYVQVSAEPHPTFGPSMALLIEDSPDGTTWGTADSVDFTAAGTEYLTIDSPQDYVRVRWSVTGGRWKLAVVSKLGPAAGGGTVELPLDLGPGLFQVDENGNVTMTTRDGEVNGTLVLRVGPGGDANETDVFLIKDEGGGIRTGLAAGGGAYFQESPISNDGFSFACGAASNGVRFKSADNAYRFYMDRDGKLAFHGVAPVAQAAHPTLLGDVITILVNLGLCAAS